MVKFTLPLVPPPGVGLKTVTVAVPAVAILVAGTDADICVALIKVVVSAAPFHLIADVVTKFVPVATMVNDPEPAVAVFGAMLVKVGTGFTLVTVNVSVPLVPPPGVGVKMVIAAVPAALIFEAGMEAVSCEALIYVVVSAVPFHFITDPFIKLLPLAVKVNAPLPAVALFGERLLSVGSGLLAVMVNVCAALVPPPGKGVKTVTGMVPADEIFAAGTVAVNCVGLIKVVTSDTPFQLTTAPLIKLLPVTVNVKAALPATAALGLMEVEIGTGLLTITGLMVKLSDPLVPPPGVGVNTATAAVPAVAIFAAGTTAVNCVELA